MLCSILQITTELYLASSCPVNKSKITLRGTCILCHFKINYSVKIDSLELLGGSCLKKNLLRQFC